MAQEKSQVIVLGGFLGSGKTTLLQYILSLQADLEGHAVVLNDFGTMGVDGQIIQSHGLEVMEMSSGCICCTLQIDMQETLSTLIQNFKPRVIYIEASGIADPGSIKASLLAQGLIDKLELKKVITVLDSEYWDARESFGDVFLEQLAAADIILLNKSDQFAQEKISRCLREIHDHFPESIVIPTVFCRIEPDILELDLSALEPLGKTSHKVQKRCADHIHQPQHLIKANEDILSVKEYKTFTFTEDIVFDEQLFEQFLQDLPWEMFRIKGFVRFAYTIMLLNFVGGKAQWTVWETPEKNGLVFIGWANIDQQAILDELKKCALS